MTDLQQLRTVAQAKYEEQRQVYVKIVHEESVLRAELDRLSNLDKSSAGKPQPRDGMQRIGADLLWSSWMSRSITTLNIKLARVLARKAREQDHIRQAFGKLTALNALIDEERTLRQKTRSQADLSESLSHALYIASLSQ